ncbi:MAG TPA: S8 family serine peptidase [Labilithrix sp.]|nr:S8 family serine peptidase [Labilithrix sp.]
MPRFSPALRLVRLVAPLGLVATLLVDARTASSSPPEPPSPAVVAPTRTASEPGLTIGRPNGASYLHLLGRHAGNLLSPSSGTVGALVALPRGQRASDYGLEEVAPGIGRMRATPARIEAFGFAHPELRLEVGPPLHTLLDRAGQWIRSDVARRERGADGRGVLVGVIDTGLDVTHPEMVDVNGKSRVAWLLDLSLEPVGVHEELEQKYGIPDANGKIANGAVLSKKEIDTLLARIANGSCVEKSGTKCAPSDEVGHGTHVAGIAAARGAGGHYPGIAPAADLVIVRGTRGRSEGLDDDDVMHAVQFLFDRADFEKRPMVVNISLGSDFGPHDGSLLWETTIASLVGPNFPGHAVVAAAGNVGSIAEEPVHQSVRATKGATMRVPVRTRGADSGSVQVWVTLREGADLKIGLDGPDGEWIAPVAEGHQNGKNTDDYNAGVIFGSGVDASPIPAGSRGAVVVWTGKWPTGTYSITLEGTGLADLYVQGLGDAALGSDRQALFTNGVREGTISSPATHPGIIAVGCTVNRPSWTSIAGVVLGPRIPLLDGPGGLPAPRLTGADAPPTSRGIFDGEICWFSSAGPTPLGVPKPEIAAPGAFVVSAMSRTATPGTSGSIFTNPNCPALKSGKTDARCYQVDDSHAVAAGTSMSSPVVAGVVALLLQKDPTLTQDKIIALLQAGAHRFRYPAPFNDQSGPGEVDAMGALDALDQMRTPTLQLPAADQSWLTLSSDYVPADGSTGVTAIVELRTADGQHRADFFDKGRLVPVLLVDGVPFEGAPEIIRRGPGVWFYVWRPPPGLGGSRATFGATFDGVAIVAPRTVPIASDGWNAAYPSHAGGSHCAVTTTSRTATSTAASATLIAGVMALAALRRRRRTA